MMSFRPGIVAALLSLIGSLAIEQASNTLAADPVSPAEDGTPLSPEEQQFFEQQVRT